MWGRTHGHGPEGLVTRAVGVLAFAVMAVLITAVLPCTASAATGFSSISPVPDSVLVGSPDSLRAYVQADSAVLTSSRIAVDGVNLATYVDWPGHWEDPTCQEVWIVDDYTKGTISADKAEGFSAGTHTAVLTVNTASSGSSTYTWSFTVTHPANQLATFSARNPAANTTTTSLPIPRVTIESTNAISGYNADLFVDGTIVNHTFRFVDTKKFNLYTVSAIAMTDGLHTVKAKVLDSLRIPSEDSWSFTVAVKPTLNSPEPSSGSTVHVSRPPIRVIIADNTPGPLRMVLRLDGVQKFDGMVPQGTFRWDPTADFATGSTHTVRADVYDAAGNTQTLSWSFTATAAAPMSTGNDCKSCHPASAHPFNNCTGCHQDDPLYDPHGPNRYGPVGPCYDCHGSSYAHVISPDCAYCHSSAQWVQIPRHNPSAQATKHVSATQGCDTCHDTSLPAEHGKYPSTSTFKYQCELCHTSARPEVIAAVSANDTNCLSCHTSSDAHRSVHVSTSVPAGSVCVQCHDGNLITEHVTGRGLTCASCHDAGGTLSPASLPEGRGFAAAAVRSTSEVGFGIAAAMAPSDVASAVANGVTSCGACHGASVNHLAAHDNSGLDSDCASCHQSNISTVHADACDMCHTSADPAVVAAIAANDLDCTSCHTMDAHPAVSRTWNYNQDYYSWGSTTRGGSLLSSAGANPTNPGVHGNYQSTTAKCGICHSVHRANANGVKLLNTATATCAGCHKAGASTVTAALVSWQPGGPHGSGVDADCNSTGCHLDNPHGAGGSKYKIMAAKLIKPEVDDVLEAPGGPLSNAASGITADDLNAESSSTWDARTRSAVVAGYTCNTASCHEQTMLTVLRSGWAEERRTAYPSGPSTLKTGHLSSAEATEAHSSYAPATGCTGCHDQTDASTRSGFTFPHSQSAYATATSNSGATRAYLWMTYAGSVGASGAPMGTVNEKSFDGACLKCHRSSGGTSGIGLDH